MHCQAVKEEILTRQPPGDQLLVDGSFETDIRDLMSHRSRLKRLKISKKEDGKSVFGKSHHVMAKTHKGAGMLHGF